MGVNTATTVNNSVITPGAWDDFPAALSGKYMQVEGRPDKMQVGLTQEVYVNGSAGDIYVLGGWGERQERAERHHHGQGVWLCRAVLPHEQHVERVPDAADERRMGGLAVWLLPAAGAGGV